MMYRAILRVLVEGKPMQIYGGDLIGIREWAKAIADKYGAPVDINIKEERLLETVEPKPELKLDA